MNIVGENFPEEIVKQIDVRQKKKGSKIRDNQNLVWQNSNTGWVKMISSVNINKEDRLKVSNTEMANVLLSENQLARQYVLFGGAFWEGFSLDGTSNKYGFSSGIARNQTVLNHSAYGLGGLDLGLKPMPGITSFSIKSENRGSLKTAIIGIKCYNRQQFDIINTLYLSLGYSVLIEWGNAMYYDNNEEFEKENTHSLADKFLGINKSGDFKWNNILDSIREERLKSCGNYDAALGRIVNFSWTINRDLSYDITVIVRSVGDIIESLKMNALSGYIPVSLAEQVTSAFVRSGAKDFNRFVLDNAAFVKQVYDRLRQNGLDDNQARGILANILSESVFDPGAYTADDKGLPAAGLFQWRGSRLTGMINAIGADYGKKWQKQIDYALIEDYGPRYKATKFRTAEEAAKDWADNWERPALNQRSQRVDNVKFFPPGLNLSTNTNIPTNTQSQEQLLQSLNSNLPNNNTINTGTGTYDVIPLQNPTLPSTTLPSDNNSIKIISKYAYTHDVGALFYNMMVKLNNNPSFNPTGTSVDAVKISFDNNGATTDQYYVRFGYFLQQIEENIIYQLKGSDEKNPSKIIKFDYDIDSNIILLYSRQISANPNACIFKRKFELSDGTDITLFPELNDFLLKGSGSKYSFFYGKIMNIYFNMKDILLKMEDSKNADTGVLTLIDLLKILTRTFCDSTGNYNNIEPTIDSELNIIRFIDSVQLPDFNAIIANLPSGSGFNKSNIPAEFNMFGYRQISDPDISTAGIVRDLSLTTTVSPNLVSMITIGAQANGYVTGQDSTALSVMNYGLTDRVKEEWIEPNNPNAYPPPPSIPVPPPTSVPSSSPISNQASLLQALNSNLPKNNTINTGTGTYPVISLKNPTLTNPTPTPPAPPEPSPIIVKYKDVIASFNRFVQEMAQNIWNQEDIIAFSNSIQSFAEYNQAGEILKQRQSNPLASSPNIGFLPFDLTLTIDGLSGMKIYQKFIADTEFLPSNYPKSLEFLIKGITHEIKDNQWVTKLESLAVPKNPFGTKDKFNVGARISGQQGLTERAGGAGLQSTNFTPVPGNIKSVTSNIPIKPTGHQVGKFKKTQIVLHYSAGDQNATAADTINILNNRSPGGLSYHYIILANGFVEQMIPDEYKAYHVKSAGVNTYSIGISLENLGWAKDANTSSYGPIPSNQTRAVRLVDFYGNPKPYRNTSWAQEITDAQYRALINLIKKVKRNNPDITWPGLTPETFQTMFSEGISWSASRPGLYSHGAVQENKLDVLPTPKVVAALKSIGPL